MKTIGERTVIGKHQTNYLHFLGPIPPRLADDCPLILIHILGFQTLSFLARFVRAPL